MGSISISMPELELDGVCTYQSPLRRELPLKKIVGRIAPPSSFAVYGKLSVIVRIKPQMRIRTLCRDVTDSATTHFEKV